MRNIVTILAIITTLLCASTTHADDAAYNEGLRWALQNAIPAIDITPRITTKAPEFIIESDGKTLTEEEYAQLQELLANRTATPIQVGLTNVAVKGTSLFMVSVMWLVFILILRRVFDYHWDKDIWENTWASVTIISVMLLCTAYILRAVVA